MRQKTKEMVNTTMDVFHVHVAVGLREHGMDRSLFGCRSETLQITNLRMQTSLDFRNCLLENSRKSHPGSDKSVLRENVVGNMQMHGRWN